MDRRTSPEDSTSPVTTAIEDILGALDTAAILFDGDGRCVTSNDRFDRAFFPPDDPPPRGEQMMTLKRRMAAGGHIALFPGMSAQETAEAYVNAIRGFVRDMEFPLADGRVFVGTSNPTACSDRKACP